MSIDQASLGHELELEWNHRHNTQGQLVQVLGRRLDQPGDREPLLTATETVANGLHPQAPNPRCDF